MDERKKEVKKEGRQERKVVERWQVKSAGIIGGSRNVENWAKQAKEVVQHNDNGH